MRISDWSSDVCSSDLLGRDRFDAVGGEQGADLADLAFVVAGDDELAWGELADRLRLGALADHAASALSCARKMSVQHIRASRRKHGRASRRERVLQYV